MAHTYSYAEAEVVERPLEKVQHNHRSLVPLCSVEVKSFMIYLSSNNTTPKKGPKKTTHKARGRAHKKYKLGVDAIKTLSNNMNAYAFVSLIFCLVLQAGHFVVASEAVESSSSTKTLDGYDYPNLYDESIPMLWASKLVYSFAKLVQAGREGK